MEQIIPILIAAGIFAFQAYANYQKEQEKARQRRQTMSPNAPRNTGSDEVIYNDEVMYEDELEYEYVEYPASLPPTPAPASVTKPKSAPPPTVQTTPDPYGAYQGAWAHSRRRTQTFNTQPSSDLKLEVVNLDDEDDSWENAPGSGDGHRIASNIAREGLNLHEAVIHSVILGRPYV